MIYFVQPTDGGPIKIGTTIGLTTRIKQLEATYGLPLVVLHTMEGDRSVESDIHARFAHLRLGRTEQFRPAPELMAFIGRPLLVDANPDTIEAMPQDQPRTIAMRSSGEYAAWVEMVAKGNRSTVAALIDQALVRYAKAIGFTPPPPKR